MQLTDYNEFADPMQVPINGKLYTLPPVGLRDGQRILTATEQNTPLTNEELRRMLLGATYDEMLADNVPGPAFARAVLTALSEFKFGRATAEITWETGGDPKALQALATREGGASTTPPPVSGSGTRKSSPASRSGKSSSTGSSSKPGSMRRSGSTSSVTATRTRGGGSAPA